jgi:hypothetical protein
MPDLLAVTENEAPLCLRCSRPMIQHSDYQAAAVPDRMGDADHRPKWPRRTQCLRLGIRGRALEGATPRARGKPERGRGDAMRSLRHH